MVSTLQNQVQEQNHRLDALEHLLFEAKDVLTVEEAAMFLGLSKSFVYKMTHEGSLPFYKPNGKVCYFEKAALLDWMLSTKVASTGGTTYQIAYKKKGTSKWKYTTTTSKSKTIKSLKKGKKYYVKVRAYKTVDGKKIYGSWSKTKLSKKIK